MSKFSKMERKLWVGDGPRDDRLHRLGPQDSMQMQRFCGYLGKTLRVVGDECLMQSEVIQIIEDVILEVGYNTSRRLRVGNSCEYVLQSHF